VTGLILEQSQRSWNEAGVAFWGLLDFLGPDRAVRGAIWVSENLPNGQELWGWAMWSCSGVYVLVSLFQKARGQPPFDLDRLLHRGRYELAGETEQGTGSLNRGWRALGVTREFGRRDRFLYLLTWGWNVGWVLIFAAVTVFFLTGRLRDGEWSRYDSWWLGFWHTKIWIELTAAMVVIVWFTYGGIRDVKALLRDLDQRDRDDADDGFIARDIPD
jgi:SSS family solute:Na+ symporter